MAQNQKRSDSRRRTRRGQSKRILFRNLRALRVSFEKKGPGWSVAVLLPSFPHAFSGNPGELRTGPPIKAFGGDELGRRAGIFILFRRAL